MSPPKKMTVAEANRLEVEEFVEKFGSVFEGSPYLVRSAWNARPFEGFDDLSRAFREAMYTASRGEQLALIRAHPDLAGKAVVAGELTAESVDEQASAGLDRLSPEEYEAFTAMNAAYRAKFSFPMIVCVRNHDKASILRSAGDRLGNSYEEEFETALAEISRVADLRLRDLVEETEEGGRRVPDTSGERGVNPGIMLGQHNYGKCGVRLVKVFRGSERHEVMDLDVAVTLEGDFGASYVEGDNTRLLATDTMRNTVYALAKDHLASSIEEFGLVLVDHFLRAGPTVERARVDIIAFPWGRIEADGKPHDHSFLREAGERLAMVTGSADGYRSVEAGLGNLTVMKTTQSGWQDFFRDEYTTLPDTDDRILATVVTARWEYGDQVDSDYDRLWARVRERLLSTFTDHYSPSVQNTLYRMGRAVLEEFGEIEKIHLSFPNKHYLLYDLSRFGMENENEIFQATDEPYGLIEGTVERTS